MKQSLAVKEWKLILLLACLVFLQSSSVLLVRFSCNQGVKLAIGLQKINGSTMLLKSESLADGTRLRQTWTKCRVKMLLNMQFSQLC